MSGRPLELEKHPREGTGWEYQGRSPYGEAKNSIWTRGRFRVISGLGPFVLPQTGGKVGPTWHLSVARRGNRRCTDDEVRRVLGAFALRGAEEDNHMPGAARHFFLPVDPAFRGPCDCKETDETITEADGLRWQTPAGDVSRCGGCAFEAISGEPCRLHADQRRDPAGALRSMLSGDSA